MAQRQLSEVRADLTFKGRPFTAEVILWAVRWYLMFSISYHDVELMLQDRGVTVARTTINSITAKIGCKRSHRALVAREQCG